jgi:hypothetical protein
MGRRELAAGTRPRDPASRTGNCLPHCVGRVRKGVQVDGCSSSSTIPQPLVLGAQQGGGFDQMFSLSSQPRDLSVLDTPLLLVPMDSLSQLPDLGVQPWLAAILMVYESLRVVDQVT